MEEQKGCLSNRRCTSNSKGPVIKWCIWYHLHNFKNAKNTHGGVLHLVKLQAFREKEGERIANKVRIFSYCYGVWYKQIFTYHIDSKKSCWSWWNGTFIWRNNTITITLKQKAIFGRFIGKTSFSKTNEFFYPPVEWFLLNSKNRSALKRENKFLKMENYQMYVFQVKTWTRKRLFKQVK